MHAPNAIKSSGRHLSTRRNSESQLRPRIPGTLCARDDDTQRFNVMALGGELARQRIRPRHVVGFGTGVDGDVWHPKAGCGSDVHY